jgi:hypothetical protein
MGVELESGSNTRRCRIVIRGRLSDRLGSAFPEMALERRPGQTAMCGRADHARLLEVLDRLRDLGIEPVSVDVDD